MLHITSNRKLRRRKKRKRLNWRRKQKRKRILKFLRMQRMRNLWVNNLMRLTFLSLLRITANNRQLPSVLLTWRRTRWMI